MTYTTVFPFLRTIIMTHFSRFPLLTASRYTRNLSKRYHTLIASSAFVESVTELEKETKRNYSFTRVLCTDIPNFSYEKLILNQGSNISFRKEDMKLVLKPYLYGSSIPKKESRSDLVKACNYWMNLSDDLCGAIDGLFSMLIECETMLDDIQDKSDYRRGSPTAYKIYGANQTHISERLCLFLVLKGLIGLNNMKAIEAYADIFVQHYVGEYKEVFMRDYNKCPTIEEYAEICVNKNQPVVNIVIKFMQPFSDCKIDFSQLSRGLSIHYQLVNDISNLYLKKNWDNQGFCTDISEGKYTLAIIHAINSNTQEGDLVSAIIHQKTKDLPTLKLCLSLLQKLGSIDFVKKTVRKHEKELKDEIERLGGNPLLVEYINKMTCMKYEEI